jgi:hypothetical protein
VHTHESYIHKETQGRRKQAFIKIVLVWSCTMMQSLHEAVHHLDFYIFIHFLEIVLVAKPHPQET